MKAMSLTSVAVSANLNYDNAGLVATAIQNLSGNPALSNPDFHSHITSELQSRNPQGVSNARQGALTEALENLLKSSEGHSFASSVKHSQSESGVPNIPRNPSGRSR